MYLSDHEQRTLDIESGRQLDHAAHQHAHNEVEFNLARAAVVAVGTIEQQKRLDIAQSALRASTATLEGLLEGGEG